MGKIPPKLKYPKQIKGRNQPQRYRRGICQIHPACRLIQCERCSWYICPGCNLRCWLCQKLIDDHPILGPLT